MTEIKERTLGEKVPASPHAVCVHMPRLADAIGYEEKDPEILKQIRSGYPRFVLHPYIARLADILKEDLELQGRHGLLLTSKRAARELRDYLLDESANWTETSGLVLFHCEDTPENRVRSREFLQHTGCGISSRLAEDCLLERGELNERFAEKGMTDRPDEYIRNEIAKLLQGVRMDAILLCNSGMNAFYSVFKAIRDLGREEERSIWIQFGWLYLDTTRILERFSRSDEEIRIFPDIRDHEALESFLQRSGRRVAGCITEIPTNPLMQTVDLHWLRELADQYGFPLVIDPSMASLYNVNVLPCADVIVNSLTKYAASEGDVMMGVVAINPTRPWAREVLSRTVVHHDPPYERDLWRMAEEIGQWGNFLRKVNETAALVASFLEEHPRVKAVHWAYSRKTRTQYEAISRWPIAPGAVVTFELDFPMKEFYDRCPLVKGPSFGAVFSILCPYLYLAHYDLVSTEEGRRKLAESGLNPELLRLSVGSEDPDAIIEALGKGLES